jgi:hypothetical protein
VIFRVISIREKRVWDINGNHACGILMEFDHLTMQDRITVWTGLILRQPPRAAAVGFRLLQWLASEIHALRD